MVSCPVANVSLSAVGLNQEIYQRLKLTLSLNLRRQIFIAVCDDLNLRDRLAAQLQTEINLTKINPAKVSSTEILQIDRQELNQRIDLSRQNGSSEDPYPQLVSLQLELDDPNPLLHIAQWLTQSPPPFVQGQREPMPAFQILGVEHLTRQDPAIQRLFFTHLQTIERNLPLLDFSLLIWMTQPWFHAISHSAPEFWRCRTGVFEFVGDPTPLTVTSPERFDLLSSLPSSKKSTSGSEYESLKNGAANHGAANHGAANQITQTNGYQDLLHQDSEQSIAASLASSHSQTHIQREEYIEEYIEEPTDDAVVLKDWAIENQGLTDEQEADARVGSPFIVDDWLSRIDESTEFDLEELEQVLPAEVAQSQSAFKTASEDLIEDEEISVNPWVLSEDEFDQLYEPESELDYEFQQVQIQDSQISEQIPADRPFIPFTLQLPEGLAEQPQLTLLLRQIEQLHQQRVSPVILAEAYRTFGNSFRDQIEQGAATPQHLVIAIQAYEQTLVLLPEGSPIFVDVLNDLGNLYWMLSRTLPNGAEVMACLQQGIQSYQAALTRIAPANKAQTYPMVQNNLGAAYADLARHQEPVENLERSIHAYQQALSYRKPDTDPLRYASTQNNLGTTYWNLAQYKDAVTNLKQAIVAYSEALRYYDPMQESLNYAMIQNNLGTAYWNVAQHERPLDWLKLAVAAYQEALQYRTISMPAAHAATQNNLGTAYWHIANQTSETSERIDCLQQAIVAYEAALQAIATLQSQSQGSVMLNFDQFATHNNLGIAHYQLATEAIESLDTTTRSNHLQAALNHHVLAEQGWQGKDTLRQTAVSCIIQTVRATYHQLGLSGQNVALSGVPGYLLPEILPKL
jgi:tetratricopeptide (TPR) repeat protein